MIEISVSDTKDEMGRVAAAKVASIFRDLQKKQKKVRFLMSTGASQFEFLDHLVKEKDIDWSRTEMFHLDEYVGLSESHPASFRNYLQNRFITEVHPGKVHLINGDAPNTEAERIEYGELISEELIDVGFIGIGENGHIAFNDPPADFKTPEPFLIVELDRKCRQQQVGEGWFSSVDEVPKQAISASVPQIMKAKVIVCVCPDDRKAEAVRNCLSKATKVDTAYPGSIFKVHPEVYVFLDKASAKFL